MIPDVLFGSVRLSTGEIYPATAVRVPGTETYEMHWPGRDMLLEVDYDLNTIVDPADALLEYEGYSPYTFMGSTLTTSDGSVWNCTGEQWVAAPETAFVWIVSGMAIGVISGMTLRVLAAVVSSIYGSLDESAGKE